MRRNRILLGILALVAAIVAVVVLWPQGTAGPEPIAHGKDTCARCRMAIGPPGFAGEIVDRAGQVTKYDDLGCLLEARTDLDVAGAWVEDHETGRLVPLERAVFVKGGATTPMGHGIVAFESQARAQAFAERRGGVVTALGALDSRSPPGPRPGDPRGFTEADVRAGKAVFLRECSACHGERGDGRGSAAPFLPAPPRNFLKGKFRVRTTPSGKPPTTADILRTIERGLPGSGMPAFAFLSPEERRQVTAYVLDRADLLESPEPEPLADPGEPPPASPDSVSRGQALYTSAGCAQCHGPTGRGDGAVAATLKDEDGRSIPSRDFASGFYRGGRERKDLFLRLSTGLDGTPMPSYASSLEPEDRWALADYLLSLQTVATKPLPADPMAAGRAVAEKYACRACHVLDDGRGGDAGPDLRVSGQKLSSDWIRAWLDDPRSKGKIYPWRQNRMPDLRLSDAEVDVMTRYLAAMGRRRGTFQVPDTSTFPAARLTEGKNFFVLRCTECHQLGDVIPTPAVKQQGPDLIHVTERVDFEWALGWILDPRRIDPKTRMTVPNITREQAESVRMFVWKTALERGRAAAP